RMTTGGAPSLVVLAAGMARRYGGCKPLAPIGPNGEAVIDLLVSDALTAGFGQVVLVLHPETGPAIRYHVERCWPGTVVVDFAEQRLPLGTVHAVLAARHSLGPDHSFAVANADDVYGEAAMTLLAGHLAGGGHEHALISYELQATVATNDPVTRGICLVDEVGHLVGLTERRHVVRQGPDRPLRSDDGLEPVELDGTLPASVNLWGFQPEIWDVFAEAMAASGLDENALVASVAAGEGLPKAEVLLPDVVAAMVGRGSGRPVRVLATDAKLIGVTHAADLPVVNAELARQVAWGVRPSRPWSDRSARSARVVPS
ncbi:MAG: NTP transferase domain-containing protein, partial [Acidimicrobiales bacterium]|nr:NTP transferase domain-containing protein [Acidimicrobiales bacterium]